LDYVRNLPYNDDHSVSLADDDSGSDDKEPEPDPQRDDDESAEPALTEEEQEQAARDFAEGQKDCSQTGIIGQVFHDLDAGFNPVHSKSKAYEDGWKSAAKNWKFKM
jgi:hypothetical protein